MGLFRATGKVLKPLVNFPRWMGLKDLIRWPKAIVPGMVRGMLKRTPTRHETFEEARVRLKVTEEDLQSRSKQLVLYAGIYMVIALLFVVYGIFLIGWTDYWAAIAMIILSVAMGLLAYREHFRHFQIVQRRLGCTFKEWLRFYIRNEKKQPSLREKKK